MATPASRPLQDQNRNIFNHGIALGGTAEADKKGGGDLGGRKALKDISNSRKPSVHYRHPVRKDNSMTVFSTEKYTKRKLTMVPEKRKVGGRKALTDLTNSAKPTLEQVGKNIPSCVAEEGFLHDHQKCITAQMKATDMDMDYYLKLAGLQQDISPVHLSATRAPPLSPKRSPKLFEMEDLPKPEFLGYFSPARHQLPPQSPKAPYVSFEDDGFCDFKIMATP